jgi:hypothetical protein
MGIIYMLFIGIRLIPKRLQKEERFEEIGTTPFFVEMVISPGSPLVDKTQEELNLGSEMELNVVLLSHPVGAILPDGL